MPKRLIRSILCPVLLLVPVLLMTSCDDEYLKGLPNFYLEMGNSYNTLDEGKELRLDQSGLSFMVFSKPIVSSLNVLNVQAVKVQNGEMAMRFYFDAEGQRELYRQSVTNMGRMIVTVVDGKAIGARQIDGPLEGGIFYTFTELSDEEMLKLVATMQESLREVNRLKRENGI